MNRKFISIGLMSLLCFLGTTKLYGYEIKGKIAASVGDVEGKYVYLLPYGAKSLSEVTDSAKVSNNSFVFSGEDKEEQIYRIFIKDTASGKNYNTLFLLEKGNMLATLDNFSSVTGTPENDAFAEVQKKIFELQSQVKELEPAIKERDSEAIKRYRAIVESVNNSLKSYILDNTNKLTAAKFFTDLKYNLSVEEQEEIFAVAGDKFKSFPGVEAMKKQLEIVKRVAPGNKFIDFEMADAEGNMHKISEYIGTGKVVLLDFWASWCGPCMREVPNIKKVYDKYKDKGFEIVGISFDNKRDNWLNTVKEKEMNWVHLSDVQGWKSLAAPIYGINSIPATFLIDKDGTILQRNIMGAELDEKLAELLK